MKRLSPYSHTRAAMLGLLLSTIIVQGCTDNDDNDDNDDNEAMAREYSITIINLTNNQPFTPITALLHKESQPLFKLGTPASSPLEKLAESGDNKDLIDMVDSSSSGTDKLAAGGTETLVIKDNAENFHFTLLTMPANTNDAFVGLNGIDLSGLNKGESIMRHAKIYDAGTEGNSEAASDIPGQSGEGYNSTRDDRDFIAIHPGIVGIEDGLTNSALNATHRFDNPGAKVIIRRTK